VIAHSFSRLLLLSGCLWKTLGIYFQVIMRFVENVVNMNYVDAINIALPLCVK